MIQGVSVPGFQQWFSVPDDLDSCTCNCGRLVRMPVESKVQYFGGWARIKACTNCGETIELWSGPDPNEAVYQRLIAKRRRPSFASRLAALPLRPVNSILAHLVRFLRWLNRGKM